MLGSTIQKADLQRLTSKHATYVHKVWCQIEKFILGPIYINSLQYKHGEIAANYVMKCYKLWETVSFVLIFNLNLH